MVALARKDKLVFIQDLIHQYISVQGLQTIMSISSTGIYYLLSFTV
jgi:hypothetical protein